MSYFNPIPKLGPPRLLYIVTDLQRVRYSPGVPLFVSSDYAAALQVFNTHEPEMAFAYDRGEPMMNLCEYSIDGAGWCAMRILEQRQRE